MKILSSSPIANAISTMRSQLQTTKIIGCFRMLSRQTVLPGNEPKSSWISELRCEDTSCKPNVYVLFHISIGICWNWKPESPWNSIVVHAWTYSASYLAAIFIIFLHYCICEKWRVKRRRHGGRLFMLISVGWYSMNRRPHTHRIKKLREYVYLVS